MLPTEGQFDNKATPSSLPLRPLPPRTLVAVEISHAVLARDVLPVGAARQRDGLGERLPGVDLEETRRGGFTSGCHFLPVGALAAGGGRCVFRL